MILWILAALMLLLALQGALFMHIALRRKPFKGKKKPGRTSKGPASFHMDRDWLKAQTQEDIFIQSRDGLKLHARLIPRGNCRRFAILCHGYRAHSASMASFARKLHERGFALLLPDARAHGESEGEWIGMGWLERLDLLDWIGEINLRYASPDILLMGISMGGATVMNVSGEDLPANVRCIIEDCGFTSIRDEFVWQLRKYHHLPALPFLIPAEPLCRWMAGYSLLRNGNSCAQLRRCKKPMLFIHGSADRYVPPQMLEQAYAATSGAKEWLIIEGAPHADSATVDAQHYWSAVDGFLLRHMPLEQEA